MLQNFKGFVEVITPGRVKGWACDAGDPGSRLTVVIRNGETTLAEVEASKMREDLVAAGIGDGRHGFEAVIPYSSEPHRITVHVKGTDRIVPLYEGAFVAHDLPDTQLNVTNFELIRSLPPKKHFYIRLDTNFDCNLHCVYCHNPRSKQLISVELFKEFLHTKIISVENFQIGCAMEPTLDTRLTDFMLMVSDSPAKPSNIFQLQTNGTLLHRHDFKRMSEAGLTSLSVSLDSAQPETQKLLRSGTSLQKVLRNVAEFRNACPEIAIQFITTVTSANANALADIIPVGVELGVSNFIFREMFYDRESSIVDHRRMPGLLLKPGQFASLRKQMEAQFPDLQLEFLDADILDSNEEKIRSDSKLSYGKESAPA